MVKIRKALFVNVCTPDHSKFSILFFLDLVSGSLFGNIETVCDNIEKTYGQELENLW